MRRSLSSGVNVALATSFSVSLVLADHCHRPPPLESSSTAEQSEAEATVRVEARGLFATFDTKRYRGSYEGLSLAGAWSNQRWRAEASLPVYRLVRNGKIEQGPGDALLAVSFTGYSDELLRVGLEVAGTLPSGEARAELGMGHVMLMTTAWGSLDLDGTVLSSRLSYSTALGETSHHHGAGVTPLVAPMNARELGAALFANETVMPRIGVQLGANLAVPVNGGQRRSIVSGAVLFDAGALDSLVQLELPLLGDPFTARVSTTLAMRW
jgi:hypothetical protein